MAGRIARGRSGSTTGAEEKMDEIITTLDIEKGREYLIFGNLTIKPFIMETKETLLKENPWRVLAEKIEKNGYMRLEKLNAYADDSRLSKNLMSERKTSPSISCIPKYCLIRLSAMFLMRGSYC